MCVSIAAFDENLCNLVIGEKQVWVRFLSFILGSLWTIPSTSLDLHDYWDAVWINHAIVSGWANCQQTGCTAKQIARLLLREWCTSNAPCNFSIEYFQMLFWGWVMHKVVIVILLGAAGMAFCFIFPEEMKKCRRWYCMHACFIFMQHCWLGEWRWDYAYWQRGENFLPHFLLSY